MIINISPDAQERIENLTKKGAEDENAYLVISLSAGGCSGVQVVFDLKKDISQDSIIFTSGNAKVAVIPNVLELINGSTLKYTSSLMSSYLHLEIPNANASCSCGSSFDLFN